MLYNNPITNDQLINHIKHILEQISRKVLEDTKL